MIERAVAFVNEKVKQAFEALDNGAYEEKELKKYLERAISDLKENPRCGVQIKKKLIPKEYVQKYNVQNLWKYNLPNAWCLVYTISSEEEIAILSVLVEWFDHKNYEKRFKYK